MNRMMRIALAAGLPGAARAQAAAKSATFSARQEFKVMIPEGTKKVRAWFAMPQ